jgi:hypothetical protein
MTQPCPQDCQWNAWTEWTECTKTCDQGFQSRTRIALTQPAEGGKSCAETSQVKFCNSQACPDNCVVSDWNDWGTCSKTCGGGLATRTRNLAQPTNGGKVCPHDTETDRCSTGVCPVDCTVTVWVESNDCVVSLAEQRPITCGIGVYVRSRMPVINTAYGGKACPMLVASTECNLGACPTTGCMVSDWSYWTPCSHTCGPDGKRSHARNIITEHDAADCPDTVEEEACNPDTCPIDCELSEWSDYGSCSASCWAGNDYTGSAPGDWSGHDPIPVPKQTRTRSIITTPNSAGKQCDDISPQSEDQYCNTHRCGIDCIHGNWTAWTTCSHSCGTGFQERTRNILQKEQYNGKPCAQTYKDIQACHVMSCPDDCQVSQWTAFTQCSVSCTESVGQDSEMAGGFHHRSRSETAAALPGGKACPHMEENMACNSRAECVANMELSTVVTPAPTPLDVDAALAAGVIHTETNAPITVRTAVPTKAPTVYVPYVSKSCANGAATVASGWHGAGDGANYCKTILHALVVYCRTLTPDLLSVQATSASASTGSSSVSRRPAAPCRRSAARPARTPNAISSTPTSPCTRSST